jgi:uncharacterized phage protein gp47/JayE
MSFGLTSTGFVRKRLEDILAAVVEKEKTKWGNDILTSEDSSFNKFNAIFGEVASELWELAEAMYAAFDPDGASEDLLDRVCAFIGVTRLQATYSRVTATISGDPATVIPIGRVVAVPATGARFLTLTEVTIGGGGTVSVELEAQNAGAVEAPAGTLTEIVTPVAGWDSITNPLDAEVGRERETDSELRARRLENLQVGGAGTVEAIRARLLQEVENVTAAIVIENVELTPDVDGREGKAIEALVDGGETEDIAELLWQARGHGIKTLGDVSHNITDSQGFEHTMRFSRPTDIALWVRVEITRNTEEDFPVEGLDDIAANVLDYGNTLGIGDNVIMTRFYGPIHQTPGIEDITLKIDTVNPPVNTANISVNATSRAKFDSARIVVVDVTP